jgi:hypothetical protein
MFFKDNLTEVKMRGRSENRCWAFRRYPRAVHIQQEATLNLLAFARGHVHLYQCHGVTCVQTGRWEQHTRTTFIRRTRVTTSCGTSAAVPFLACRRRTSSCRRHILGFRHTYLTILSPLSPTRVPYPFVFVPLSPTSAWSLV